MTLAGVRWSVPTCAGCCSWTVTHFKQLAQQLAAPSIGETGFDGLARCGVAENCSPPACDFFFAGDDGWIDLAHRGLLLNLHPQRINRGAVAITIVTLSWRS